MRYMLFFLPPSFRLPFHWVFRGALGCTIAFCAGLLAVPSHAAVIGALVDGQVVQLLAKEGDQVKKGQLLLEVDARAQQAIVAQLKARLKLAELELKDAKIDFEAEKALYDQSATAKRRFDLVQLVNDRAAARVDVLRGELAEALAKLDYFMIKAPFDAKVTRVHVNLGDTVFHEHQRLIELE